MMASPDRVIQIITLLDDARSKLTQYHKIKLRAGMPVALRQGRPDSLLTGGQGRPGNGTASRNPEGGMNLERR